MMQDSDLDDLFGHMKAAPLPASGEFMARAVQTARQMQPPKPAGLLARLKAGLSGHWQEYALMGAGLGAAMVAGIWIGLAQPAIFTSVLGGDDPADLAFVIAGDEGDPWMIER